MKEWELLSYNLEGADVEDEGENERLIVVSGSSTGDISEVDSREVDLEGVDV